MEFLTTVGKLRDALTTARHATSNNPSIAAYAGVVLKVEKKTLSITASDGENTIEASFKPTSCKDGTILVLPRPLSNFLSNLEASEEINVYLNPTGDLEVKPVSSSAYSFRKVVATFPTPPVSKSAPRSADFSRLELAITAIRASTMKDNPGVQLLSSEEGLILHTTDNFRLSRALLPEAGFGNFTGVVPLNILEKVSRLDINSVAVDPKGRTIRFMGPEVTVATQLQSVSFPDVAGILEATPPTEAVISIAKIRKCLPRLNSIAEQAPLKIRFEDNKMTLSVSNADLGTGSETLTLEKDVVAPFEFFVNLSFLLATCASHNAETLNLAYSAPVEPLFVRSFEPVEVTTVLMPVKP